MAKKRLNRKTNKKGIVVPQIGLGDKVALVEKSMMRNTFPDFKPGDTVKVHVRIKEGEKERIQIYEGLVIARSNAGGSKSFNVRKISNGVGVERIFLETSPKVAKVEIAQRGKVRRAKLYYIRDREGRAARVERDIETQASRDQSAAAREAKAAAKATTKA